MYHRPELSTQTLAATLHCLCYFLTKPPAKVEHAKPRPTFSKLYVGCHETAKLYLLSPTKSAKGASVYCILKIVLKHQATVSMPLNCYLMLKAATFFSLKHEPWATLNIHFFLAF